MLRKLICLFVMGALALSFTACSGGKKEPVMEKPKGILGGEPGSNRSDEDTVLNQTVD